MWKKLKHVQKYYLEFEKDKCGESCHDSISLFIVYLFQRTKLNLANDKNCVSLGYKNYVGTQSYGILSRKTYVDIYSKS